MKIPDLSVCGNFSGLHEAQVLDARRLADLDVLGALCAGELQARDLWKFLQGALERVAAAHQVEVCDGIPVPLRQRAAQQASAARDTIDYKSPCRDLNDVI